MMDNLAGLLAQAKVYDLAHSYQAGMPHHPVHPGFTFGLSKAHGEFVLRNNASSAGECFSFGGHVGTHIDALCHFSKDGKLHGGVEVAPIQSYSGGIGHWSADTIKPIVRRGVLLDIARLKQVDVLPEDFVVDLETLQTALTEQIVEIHEGDVVLIRTGWSRYWNDAGKYINGLKGPGLNLEAARWLSSKGIHAGGSDTVAFEFIPAKTMPVHVHFLVEKGIHIIEALELKEIAQAEAREFAFVAAPLKIVGGTGAPIRPIALV